MVAVEQSAPSVTSFGCCIPALSRNGFPAELLTSCADWIVAGNGNPSRGLTTNGPPVIGRLLSRSDLKTERRRLGDAGQTDAVLFFLCRVRRAVRGPRGRCGRCR